MTDAVTLALDASTYAGSVAIVAGPRLLAVRDVAMRGERCERLMPAVALALEDAGVGLGDLTRIACGAGPGSFTSLRIAASIAKGLALGSRVPLVAVPSLMLMVAASDAASRPGKYLAVLDAMREEVFAAGFEVVDLPSGVPTIRSISPLRIARLTDIPSIASALHARPIGPGQAIEAVPHARGTARLDSLLAAAEPVDLASWEPFYARPAEAQARWEAFHGRSLSSG